MTRGSVASDPEATPAARAAGTDPALEIAEVFLSDLDPQDPIERSHTPVLRQRAEVTVPVTTR
jgi:hypothetical protein